MNKKLPSYFISFLKKITVAFVLQTVLRVIFVVFNFSFLNHINFLSFLGGIRFDWVTISYVFGPFIILSVLPLPAKKQQSATYKKLTDVFYFLGVLITVLLNLVDVIYFRFTLKRSTADVFSLFNKSTETVDLIPMFLMEYWYMLLLFLVLISGIYYLIKKINLNENSSQIKPYPLWKKAVIFIIIVIFEIIGTRGGVQLKPLTIIDAGKYAEGIDVNIVLNTPFTIIKTILEEQIEPHQYFSEQEALNYFNPKKRIIPFKELTFNRPPNVVVLILESFGKEYISYFNKNHRLTPFLDSLLQQSAVFNYSYANGRKSIEALPAIFSSIPSLMNTPFIVSNYAGNNIESLPKTLKKHGYSTHFFHGGKNGTMSFDAFCFSAGIDNYYGLNEYEGKKDSDFDGNWGIFDEPYLQYVNRKLTEQKMPFFASIFTLSSHHPFKVPKKYKDRFTANYDNLAIAPTIQYVDMALKKFFQSAQKNKWFQNTLFIITADHTSITHHNFYKNRVGAYSVPIAFYYPKKNLNNIIDTSALIQHIDIFPTVTSLLNLNDTLFSFGNNVLTNKTIGMNYLNGTYQFMYDDYFYYWSDEQISAIFNFKIDSLLKNNLIKQIPKDSATYFNNTAKAIIQTYDNALINNKMTYDE